MSEGKAAVEDERVRKNKLDEQGLCFKCGERPQNPHLSAKFCLECWESAEHIGCMATHCPNTAVGSFIQGEYCKIHLADEVASAYEDYLEMRADYEEIKKKLEDRVQEVEYDPRQDPVSQRKATEGRKKLNEMHLRLLHQERIMNWLKEDIQKAIESADISVFPLETTRYSGNR